MGAMKQGTNEAYGKKTSRPKDERQLAAVEEMGERYVRTFRRACELMERRHPGFVDMHHQR